MIAGYRVAVAGASSLQGRELIRILAERRFPVSQLYGLASGTEEEDLPVVDVDTHFPVAFLEEDATETEVDIAFLAAPLGVDAPGFLSQSDGAAPSHCVFIDLGEGHPDSALSAPLLERAGWLPAPGGDVKRFTSAHPATVMIGTLMHRLQEHFGVMAGAAQLFASASEMGAKAVEELQTQTVNLLSFQKIPQAVFGSQLAFNMLPKLGRAHASALHDLGNRIGVQLAMCLGSSIPRPALRVFQVPVFYSLALSLYVTLSKPATPEAVAKALQGERVHVRRAAEHVPSQAETTGGDEVEVGAIVTDHAHPDGMWIWATADNVRLAALNAVEIAEGVIGTPRVH